MTWLPPPDRLTPAQTACVEAPTDKPLVLRGESEETRATGFFRTDPRHNRDNFIVIKIFDSKALSIFNFSFFWEVINR